MKAIIVILKNEVCVSDPEPSSRNRNFSEKLLAPPREFPDPHTTTEVPIFKTM